MDKIFFQMPPSEAATDVFFEDDMLSSTGNKVVMNPRLHFNLKRYFMIVVATLTLVSANFPLSGSVGASILRRLAAQHTSSCPQVLVLGAAGSGERDGTKASQNDGVGAEVNLMWKRINSDLSAVGISTSSWSNPYQAVDASVLYPSGSELSALAQMPFPAGPFLALRQWVEQNLDPFMASIAQGAAFFEQKMEAEQTECPSTTMVAIGYSQGAMALHSAEVTLSKISPTTLNHVSATILLADGYQVANSKAQLFGTALSNGEGIATWAHLTTDLISQVNDVPDPATTVEICNNYDIVCDSSLSALIHSSSSGWVHTHYTDTSKWLLLYRADWAANLAAEAVALASGNGSGGSGTGGDTGGGTGGDTGGGTGGGTGSGTGGGDSTAGSISIAWSTVHPTWITMILNGFSPGIYTYTCDFASGGDQSFSLSVTSDHQTFDNGKTCYDALTGDTVWVNVGGVTSNTINVGSSSPPPTISATTYSETTGSVAHTWTDYSDAGGNEGPEIANNDTVQIACRIQGWTAPDGNDWWYLVASSPWNNAYYVSADPFYNDGATMGSLHGTPFYDAAVPICN